MSDEYKYESLPILGKTCSKITVDKVYAIYFECTDGTKWVLHHEQDCCEDVHIEDICGDLNDLVGEPLTIAEEASHYSEVETCTWTFYRFAAKGNVTIRWYGTSNGCYSEAVYLSEIT